MLNELSFRKALLALFFTNPSSPLDASLDWQLGDLLELPCSDFPSLDCTVKGVGTVGWRDRSLGASCFSTGSCTAIGGYSSGFPSTTDGSSLSSWFGRLLEEYEKIAIEVAWYCIDCYGHMVCTYYFTLCGQYTVLIRALNSQKLRVSKKGLGKAQGRLRFADSRSTAAH